MKIVQIIKKKLKQIKSIIYEYLYVTKGIKNLDILAFIAIRIYMGFHKYPSIECYWKNDKLNVKLCQKSIIFFWNIHYISQLSQIMKVQI